MYKLLNFNAKSNFFILLDTLFYFMQVFYEWSDYFKYCSEKY